MSKGFEVMIGEGFLRVADSRPVTAKTIQQFCAEIPKLARDSGISKILVGQRNIPKSISTMERFKYATEIANNFRGLKVAFLQGGPLHDSSQFGETVAVNRGATIRIFIRLEEACDWLEVDPANLRYSVDGSRAERSGL